ncbi:MAG TPA: hypothetical protein VFW54_09660, partial [Propionibacteriaceae bacterium]|nr:hypothetical protein [Propionibacteriaceae bacterium]
MFENHLPQLAAAGTLAAAEDNEHALITAETGRLQIAAHWADLHPGDALTQSRMPGTQHPVRLGGDGTPSIAEFAPAELGCVLRISDGSAFRLIGDALDLRHRLPMIWTAGLAGQTPISLDPAKARPRAVIYVHLSEEALSAGRGAARVEEVGPVLLSQLHLIFGDHCSISMKPVIDLAAGQAAVDAYESQPASANRSCCAIPPTSYLVRFGAGSITLGTRADSYEFDPASVMTRSARGKLCAMSTALSWSVVRAQLSASSWLIP